MIGKVIGTIIIILFFFGILYSIGQVREQGNQEENNQEENNQEENNQEENNQEGSGQEQTGQQQSQESGESNTGSVSIGTVELHRVGSVTRKNCQHHVSGTVENNGNKDAGNVILQIIFVNENNVPLPGGGELRLGNIPAGGQSDYEDEFSVCWSGPTYPKYELKYD